MSSPKAVSPDTVLIRFVRRKRFDADDVIPPSAFALSTEDKEQTPPLLSVWDSNLTTVEQAREFLDEPDDYEALLIKAGDITSIQLPAQFSGAKPLEVTYDELPADQLQKPGATGHCGVSGLDREKGAANERARIGAVQAALAERARKFP